MGQLTAGLLNISVMSLLSRLLSALSLCTTAYVRAPAGPAHQRPAQASSTPHFPKNAGACTLINLTHSEKSRVLSSSLMCT
jgi:hypothetical protein